MTTLRWRTIAVLCSALLLVPVFSYAAINANTTGLKAAADIAQLPTACASGANCVATIIGNVLKIALGFLGIVFLGLLLYAGFLWMTAGGEEENVKKARLMIAHAVAGLVIIGASFLLTNYVLDQLGTAITDAGQPAAKTAPTTPPTP